MAKYCLFVDESGSSTPSYQKERPYILVGCAIDDSKQKTLEETANSLKKKYWGKSNVVFHHHEFAKSQNAFSIFRSKPELKTAFKKDLLHYLHTAPVTAFVAIIDKELMETNWSSEIVAKHTARTVFFDYISFLYSRQSPRGKIIIEASDTIKDKYYLDAFKYFLSPDCRHLDKDFSGHNIRDVITSITFVTKQNNDNETQIADIFGYAAYCKFKRDSKREEISETSYEGQLIKALESKMFKIPATMGPKKVKFAKKVKGFEVIPKK